jgi:hypothetical protein
MIHLGYEIGTGKAVSIPLGHTAFTGQTQKSGKTTAAEALIDRGGIPAVVFVTKPGEKSFTEGRRILPYFKERADWEYVKDLLEARTGQSLGEKVGYLMRVCAGAKTLQQVRDNIDKELGNRDKDLQKRKVHSSRPSVHEVLAGYIDLILKELKRVPYTDKLELDRGVNIMDLSGIDENIQDMIIRSVVDRIHRYERNTVVMVPEAWKVIPEGGRSLVFDALHRLIREGATNGNFVWIDAQDLAIVNKKILKSVSVWILGRQQEANEVVRTIRHLIAPVSILPDQIKTLGVGEFLACFDTATRRVYVQPRWLGELDAIAIAKREETVETAAQVFREKKRKGEIRGVRDAPPAQIAVNATVPAKAPAAAARIAPPQQLQILDQEKPDAQKTETPSPQSVDGTIFQRGADQRPVSDHAAGDPSERNGDGDPVAESEDDETMWKEAYEEAGREIIRLRAEVFTLHKTMMSLAGIPADGEPPPVLADCDVTAPHGTVVAAYPTFDAIYAQIKERAMAEADPAVLQLLVARPELRVRIEPKVLEVDESSARGQVAKLIHEGYFAEPRNGNGVCTELLERRRFKGARQTIYEALNDVAGMGFLVCDGRKHYTATGVKVSVTK